MSDTVAVRCKATGYYPRSSSDSQYIRKLPAFYIICKYFIMDCRYIIWCNITFSQASIFFSCIFSTSTVTDPQTHDLGFFLM